VVVSSELKGMLVGLTAVTGTRVRRGEQLAEIRVNDVRAGLAEARAKLTQAEADIRLYERMATRTQHLIDAQLESQQALDKSLRDRDAARGRREEAAAEVSRLGALLEKARLVSPIDGVVLDRFKDPGEILDEGTPVLHIADVSRVRVEAEIDEYDAGRVRVGSAATMTADGFAGQVWRGHVEEIPDAVVQRGLKSQDPGRPTDTGVLKIKIALDGPTPLRLGQRVQVRVSP
jgi:RND family efflux transporter MFP subunit